VLLATASKPNSPFTSRPPPVPFVRTPPTITIKFVGSSLSVASTAATTPPRCCCATAVVRSYTATPGSLRDGGRRRRFCPAPPTAALPSSPTHGDRSPEGRAEVSVLAATYGSMGALAWYKLSPLSVSLVPISPKVRVHEGEFWVPICSIESRFLHGEG